MKPFDYKAEVRRYREVLDARIAEFVFHAKHLPYAHIASLFSVSQQKVKVIARDAGIVRGKGWRPKA